MIRISEINQGIKLIESTAKQGGLQLEERERARYCTAVIPTGASATQTLRQGLQTSVNLQCPGSQARPVLFLDILGYGLWGDRLGYHVM